MKYINKNDEKIKKNIYISKINMNTKFIIFDIKEYRNDGWLRKQLELSCQIH